MLETCLAVDANFSTWGLCLVDGMFFGDLILATVGILALLAFVAFKFNFPHEVSLTVGTGVVFMMAILFGQPMYPIVALTIIAITVYLVRGLMKPAKK